MTVSHTADGYTFTLTVKNTGAQPLNINRSLCENRAIERVQDGLRVWQEGNGPCPAVILAPITLKPGEMAQSSFGWDGLTSTRQPAAPGKYRALLGYGQGQFVGEATFTVR